MKKERKKKAHALPGPRRLLRRPLLTADVEYPVDGFVIVISLPSLSGRRSPHDVDRCCCSAAQTTPRCAQLSAPAGRRMPRWLASSSVAGMKERAANHLDQYPPPPAEPTCRALFIVGWSIDAQITRQDRLYLLSSAQLDRSSPTDVFHPDSDRTWWYGLARRVDVPVDVPGGGDARA